MSLGWECPRCHRCYSPFVQQCLRCNGFGGPLPKHPTKPSVPPAWPELPQWPRVPKWEPLLCLN